MEKVIHLWGVTKKYQKHFWSAVQTVLHGLDLEVAQGQTFGFLGPNGAGKTTTIKLIMGLIRPTAGQVRVFGADPWGPASKSRIGFLPETPYFYDYLTGREFLSFCGRLHGLGGEALERKTGELLAMLGIAEAADVQLRKYSKGMLQRVGLAQALINDPQLVVLDEPLTGLDPLGRKEFKDIILGLKSRGVTIFFSSHILPDAEMICDRVAIINRGRLLRIGSLEELLHARVKAVELTCSGIAGRALQSLEKMATSSVLTDDRWLFNLPDETTVPAALDVIRSGKGTVISIVPQKESLEEYFTREVTGNE